LKYLNINFILCIAVNSFVSSVIPQKQRHSLITSTDITVYCNSILPFLQRWTWAGSIHGWVGWRKTDPRPSLASSSKCSLLFCRCK